MTIRWDDPTAIELRKGIVDSMKESLTMEDFARAREALIKADLYPGNINGYWIPIEMPLESPTEAADEFKS